MTKDPRKHRPRNHSHPGKGKRRTMTTVSLPEDLPEDVILEVLNMKECPVFVDIDSLAREITDTINRPREKTLTAGVVLSALLLMVNKTIEQNVRPAAAAKTKPESILELNRAVRTALTDLLYIQGKGIGRPPSAEIPGETIQ